MPGLDVAANLERVEHEGLQQLGPARPDRTPAVAPQRGRCGRRRSARPHRSAAAAARAARKAASVKRRRRQHQRGHALGSARRQFDRDHAAGVVAHDVGARDAQRVEQLDAASAQASMLGGPPTGPDSPKPTVSIAIAPACGRPAAAPRGTRPSCAASGAAAARRRRGAIVAALGVVHLADAAGRRSRGGWSLWSLARRRRRRLPQAGVLEHAERARQHVATVGAHVAAPVVVEALAGLQPDPALVHHAVDDGGRGVALRARGATASGSHSTGCRCRRSR